MIWTTLSGWLNHAPLPLLGAGMLLLMSLAVLAGVALRGWHQRRGRLDAESGDSLEGYILSGVLGLLALLMGFTFALAVDRFEARRALVLQEANAIGTVYLRTQLLPEPHRARLSGLLVEYTDNRLALGRISVDAAPGLLVRNDRLLVDLWAATSAAFVVVQDQDFSSAYLESMNQVIDLDSARKAARTVRVPTVVFALLAVYLIVTAGVLGYVFTGVRGRGAAGLMLLLFVLSLTLILDIDRPTVGAVREDQAPMERLLAFLRAQPPATFDRFRIEDAVSRPSTPGTPGRSSRP